MTGPMTDDIHAARSSGDTPRILDELSRSSFAQSSAKTSAKLRRQRLRVVLILLVLSPLVLGISYTAYNQWRVQSALTELRSENEQLRTAQQNAEAQLFGLVTRLNNQLGELAAVSGNEEELALRLRQDLEMQLAVYQEDLTATRRQIGSLQNRDAQWLFAETEYLLRLASRKLQMERDPASALQLVGQVLALLRDMEEPAVSALKQNLSADQRMLAAVQLPDLAGLHRRLSLLEEAVQSLSLVTSLRDSYQEQLSQRVEQPADSGWVESGLSLLRSIFVWRQWEEAPGDMLPPQQEYYLKETLQLLLEQARLALMTGQETVYRDSLQRAENLLSRVQLQDSEHGRSMLRELFALSQEKLRADVPDISASLRMARQLMSPVSSDQLLNLEQ
jgi:uroporphyrin-III C-methyltransferase